MTKIVYTDHEDGSVIAEEEADGTPSVRRDDLKSFYGHPWVATSDARRVGDTDTFEVPVKAVDE